MAVLRAIFFDIGDTLLFDEPSLRERVGLALDSLGLAYDKERMRQAFALTEDYALERYLAGQAQDDPAVQEQCAGIILRHIGLATGAENLTALQAAFRAIEYRRVLHPQAIGLVTELKRRGFKIGAISDWEGSLPELLGELGLMPHLDALAVSAIVGAIKPYPRLFEEALRQAGVRASEAVHVGDYYELDVAGARAVGMQPVLFDWKERTPQADCVRVTTFGQLQDYLLGLEF